MLNELKFIKSGRCERKAWLIEKTGSYEKVPHLPFPKIKKGVKNKKFESALGEVEVGCCVEKENGIEFYDFYDTVKYKKYIVRTNYKRAVIESLGIKVLACFVVTVNPEFLKGGKKPFYLFHKIDRPRSSNEFLRCIGRVKDAIEQEVEPTAVMKNDCAGCEFFKKCFKLPKENIFLLKSIDFAEKAELYNRGIITFDDYLKNNPSPIAKMQILGETHIDKKGIKEYLSTLSYPLGFLDFETISPLKPSFPDYHPGDRIVTQFSYHFKNSEVGDVFHTDFIGDGITNPEPSVIPALLKATKDAKCVLSYSVYEKNCIEMLAKRFPKYKHELKELWLKIVDLEIPFRKHLYYTPLMEGRTSLKYVLPALYPDDARLSYSKMKIHDGAEAMKAYMELENKSEPEREKVLYNLRKYCALDTLALVKIVDKLTEVSK